MNIEEIREYCLTLKDTEEGFPFDETTLVFKVHGRIYALLSLDEHRINLKCEPGLAVQLREQYEEVLPGYHMNKKHWNTVVLNGMIPAPLIREWIDHSYRLVCPSRSGKRKSVPSKSRKS